MCPFRIEEETGWYCVDERKMDLQTYHLLVGLWQMPLMPEPEAYVALDHNSGYVRSSRMWVGQAARSSRRVFQVRISPWMKVDRGM